MLGMVNQEPFDSWTLTHAAWGSAAALAGMPVGPMVAVAVGYEAFEQVMERTPLGHRLFKTRTPESVQNVLTDLAVMVAAYTAVRFALKH